MSDQRAIIIGGGQAGAQGAISLRQAKFDGAIDIFCAEETPPYQRPPLSKEYLKGALDQERLFLRPENFYEAQDITLHAGVQVSAIDPQKREVKLGAGETLSYDALLLATGAPPRKLHCPGSDLGEIYYLRSLKDSDALRAVLEGEGPVAIVGAGYIGLEVAAVLCAAGREVTVIEAADRVLARVASKPVSEFYERRHREAGVTLRLGVAVEGFTGDGTVSAVKLGGGEEIPCVAALIGIGAVPETGLAESAGLAIDNGIVVDDHARTSDPHIWAAGDCANFPSPRYGRRMRLESVPNAIDQAKAAAANMAGGDVVYNAVPWFWSDQYDIKLQTAGLSEGHDTMIVRGDPAANAFSVWYFSGDKLLAVDAINDPPAFLVSKKLLTDDKSPEPSEIEDTSFDIKALMKR